LSLTLHPLSRPVAAIHALSLAAMLAGALAMHPATPGGGQAEATPNTPEELPAVQNLQVRTLASASPRSTLSASTSSSVLSVSSIRYCTGWIDWSRPAKYGRWTAPNGCYSYIRHPSQSGRPWRPSYGWCNWAAEESHLQFTGSGALRQTKHWGAPRVGAVVWFNPGVQGAGGSGHWATLVAIGPGGWSLIQEMNFYWRGGGWAKVDYRFIRTYASGVAYLY
jgi:hypothetical protein